MACCCQRHTFSLQQTGPTDPADCSLTTMAFLQLGTPQYVHHLHFLCVEPINMFISPPASPSVCKPFKIQCKPLTCCCFGYGALKTTKMNRPSLFLPPCSSSYRLLPLLCCTISPLGSSFFLLAVAAGGQRYIVDLDFHPPHRFGPFHSLPVLFAPVPSVFLCNSSLCECCCPLVWSALFPGPIWWKRGGMAQILLGEMLPTWFS